MRNLKVLKNLKLSTGLPNAAIVAAVDGGEPAIQPSRILNIELSLNFTYEERNVTEVISLQNVPVYDNSNINDVTYEDLKSVLFDIPTSYGEVICGQYESHILDDNGGDIVSQMLLANISSIPVKFLEGQGYLMAASLDGVSLRLQIPTSLIYENYLQLTFNKKS